MLRPKKFKTNFLEKVCAYLQIEEELRAAKNIQFDKLLQITKFHQENEELVFVST